MHYGLGFTKVLKRKIFEKNKFHCQKCGSNKKLNVHHIDYNKQNNEENYLITLCHSCNMYVNNNRDYWSKYLSWRNTLSN